MKAYRADVAFDGERFLDAGALLVVDDGVLVGVEPADAPVSQDVEIMYVPGTSVLPGWWTRTRICARTPVRRPLTSSAT